MMDFRTISLEHWQNFVAGQPCSTVFHHRQWIDLIRSHYRLPLSIFAVMDGERICAAAPFLQTTTLRGRTKLTSLPFTDHVPILHDGIESLTALIDGIRAEPIAQHEAVIVRCDMSDVSLPQNDTWVRHDFDLPQDVERLRSGYSSAVKRNLKKACRSGLQYSEETGLEAMKQFYRLHVATRRKLGVPVQKRSFFLSLHQHLIEAQLGFLGLVRRENEVLAAAVFLAYHDTLIYKYGASHPRQLGYRPNEFLFDNAFQSAIQRSYQRFDFGVTHRRDLGLRRFKLKWGSTEHPVPESYLHGVPKCDDDSAILRRFASHVIRLSPEFVCRSMGAALYKYSQ